MPYWFDGNNLIGQAVVHARADRDTRRAFLDQLSCYSRQRGGRFLVFFDGDDPDRTAAPRGVQIRYSAPLSADDAILGRLEAARTPSEVIVVTNDRSLKQRCRNAGAKTMDWHEFLSRMRKTALGMARSHGIKEENIDLDEWIRYFGLDAKTLK